MTTDNIMSGTDSSNVYYCDQKNFSNNNIIASERLWGDRFHDEQTPIMILLEFLTILKANKDSLLQCDADGAVRYHPEAFLRLRDLIFNNPCLDLILTKYDSDAERWQKWFELFAKSSVCFEKYADIAYLQEMFENSFTNFVAVIKLFRTNAFEADSDKRWTTRFIFPCGLNTVYTDVRVGKKQSKWTVQQDRLFFARTGEMLYLMLSRSSLHNELGKAIYSKFFEQHSLMDKIARDLQHGKDPSFVNIDKQKQITGYLPDKTNRQYDLLAEDWQAVLKNNLPVNDVVFYLSQISVLHLMRYLLSKCKEVLDDCSTDMVCEVIGPQSASIRKLAAESLSYNSRLSEDALEKYMERVKETDVWLDPNKTDSEKIAYMLQTYFLCNSTIRKKYMNGASRTADKVLEDLCEECKATFKKHAGKVHLVYGKNIGLISAAGVRRNRYVISDSLLKTLVVSNVRTPMPVDDFLDRLYKRYEIVIGPNEGKVYADNCRCSSKALADNRAVLEQRLDSLGMLRRLSDSFSYVLNPFANNQ